MQRQTGYVYSALSACLTLLLCGCSSMGSAGNGNSNAISVSSVPPGATVTADGMKIGTTPFTFNPADVFHAGFTGGNGGLLVYRYQGRLGFEKPGCKDHYIEVDDRVLSRDIRASLECDPGYQPPPPAAQAPEVEHQDDAEQRLLRIESLREKGLISEPEYRTLRQRVLDSI